MITKSIKKHSRLLTCLVALAVVFATFLAGTFTTNASDDVFGDIELKVGDTLGFVYYTSQPYTANTTMRFTINGRTSESQAYPNDGQCVFIFNDIYPHELAKEVTATILVNGKETVSDTGLSIKEYLLQMLLDPSATAAEKLFASNTLQYGEQTRLYRNANVDVSERDNVSITDDINTTIYTAYQPSDINAVIPGTAAGLGVSASSVRMSSIGVAYHNTNKYVVTLQAPNGFDMSKVSIKIGDTTLNSSSFTSKGNGKYEVTSKAINGYDIMENATTPMTTQFVLYVNGNIVQQASYSVMDYIYQLQEAQSNTLALKYARSLYRYGQAAESAYKGNRIVSIALKTNPNEIIPSSEGAHTPQGGSITAYYADGSNKVISSGIQWENKDIYGNDVKITGETHTATYTVLGRYTDPVSNKTYTVTGQASLHNDMVKVERWTDPTKYAPTSYAASYTPAGATLRCTWQNGYVANHTPSFSAINMADYKFDEYGFIPVTASYTDANSGITKTATEYLLYENPIKSISLSGTTATFSGGKNSTTPGSTTISITYSNNQVDSRTVSQSSSWNTAIQNISNSSNIASTFTWTPLTYNGLDITPTLTVTGNLAIDAYPTWQPMSNGSTSNYSKGARTVSNTCSAAAQNPETKLTIQTVPSIQGGTVTSTSSPSGSNAASGTKGSLVGGSVYVTYANGKTETIAAGKITYTTSGGITNTAYSKNVTVTAAYTGKGGKAWTTTGTITIKNYQVSAAQTSKKGVATDGTLNTAFSTSNAAGTVTVTYANGQTAVRSDYSNFIFSLNGSTSSTVYIQSITGTSTDVATRTTAGKDFRTSTRYSIFLTVDDERTTETYTGSSLNISGYSAIIYNTYASIPSQSLANATMTSSAAPTPSKTIKVTMSNGETATVTATTVATPTAITTADEYLDRTVTVTLTKPNLSDEISTETGTLTGSVTVRVINPAKSAVTHTDPNAYEVTGTGQVSGSSLSGGKVTVTFTNGKTATKDCTSYITKTDTKITDTTLISKKSISGTWTGSYSSATATDMNVVLKNPAKSASYAITSGRVVLNPTATVSGTVTVKYANGKTTTHTQSSNTIKQGGDTSNATPTTTYQGSCTVTANTTTIDASSTLTRKTGSTTANVQVAKSTWNPQATAYWQNNLSSAVQSGTASRNCPSSTSTTITMSNGMLSNDKVTATYTNGATETFEPTFNAGEYTNIKDFSASNTYTITITFPCHNYSAYSLSNFKVIVYNPVQSFIVNDKTTYFSGGNSSVSTSITGTAKRLNGCSQTVDAAEVSKTSGSVGSYSCSGETVTCTYTGSSEVNFSASFIAKYSGYSDSFTINYVNNFSVNVVTTSGGSTAVSSSTGKTSSSYAMFSFTSGNTTSYTRSNAYAKVTFNNGAVINSATASWTLSDGSAITHTAASYYKNGNSFNAGGTSSSYSLANMKASVTIDGIKSTDSFYGYVYASQTSKKYVDTDARYNEPDNSGTGNSAKVVSSSEFAIDDHEGHVGANDLVFKVSTTRTFGNGKSSSGTYYMRAGDIGKFGIYKTTSWSSTRYGYSSYSTRQYSTGDAAWRTDFHLLGDMSNCYMSVTLPSTMTFDSITYDRTNTYSGWYRLTTIGCT